jgi:hypothetical protein
MKRILMTGVIVVTAATAGYFFTQNTTSNEHSVLNYIPKNTPIFSGQLTPFPIKTYINAIADTYSTPPNEIMNSIYASENYDPDNSRVNFFLALTQRYLASMQDADTFMTTFGLAEELQAYFYTLGIMPVFKIDVVNPDAIWALLDKAEAESGFTHELRQIKQRDYRVYQLTDDTNTDTDKINLELIISQHDNLLTITLNSGLNDPLLLEHALGLTPVKQSIADSDSLNQLIEKHDFTAQSIGYINHQAVIQAITSPSDSLLGQHIAKLMTLQTEDPLLIYQQPNCKAELTSIANNWPRTVFGFKQFDINDDNATFDMSMVIESNNQTILTALTQMTGFIPEYVSDLNNTVLALGIGIDVGSLSPAISSLWNELQQPSYTCPPLQQAQSVIQQNNPAMLGVMTVMANGIKGISGAVMDYSLDESQTELAIKSLDAIISLSADDPRALYNIIATFRPELAGVKLPANGIIVELSSLIPITPIPGINPKLIIHKEHMVIFNGDKAEKVAVGLDNKPITATGIYSLSIDYSKAFTPLVTAAELSGQEVPQELKDMQDYNLRLNTGLQINEHGIETRSYVDLKSLPTATTSTTTTMP